ncbi:MAG TPA: hypothetical protein VNO31_15460 [Umezawaea sp.]|nr:hypothetical protein [Umezawaea sp.]
MDDDQLIPEAGSPLADDLEEGLAEARAGNVVSADVIGGDLQRRVVSRTFTADTEPPFGERIIMMTGAGDYLVWNGKRWAWEAEAGHLMNYDCWPPDVDGPFFEVVSRSGPKLSQGQPID